MSAAARATATVFQARGAASSGPRGARGPMTFADPLYGETRISTWAATLLASPIFQRLAGVSLSDVPGELLFGHPFPSRLEHAMGVYHLTRLARPRDRVLQVAALAHDLGHGPFSHLSEPLMRERLGLDHEQRSAQLLLDLSATLSPALARQFAWLDWREAAALVVGSGPDGRGALLNGSLDYDNIDNVARFLLAGRLAAPSYDAEALARALRYAPTSSAYEQSAPESILSQDDTPGDDTRFTAAMPSVYIQTTAEPDARGWQTARAHVYGYLHEGHRNLSMHSMLRKAVDLAAERDILPATFFDLTDTQALTAIGRALDRGLETLALRVQGADSQLYTCVWEAVADPGDTPLAAVFADRHAHLALEAALASEVGLAAHEVILEAITSKAQRQLPPLASSVTTWRANSVTAGHPALSVSASSAAPTRRVIHLFTPPEVGRDYLRRLRMAAERRLPALGAQANNAPHE